MDTEYITKKISNCQELVDNAISEDQREVYLGYLDFWQGKIKKPKITKSKEKPDAETSEGEGNPLTTPEPEVEVIGDYVPDPELDSIAEKLIEAIEPTPEPEPEVEIPIPEPEIISKTIPAELPEGIIIIKEAEPESEIIPIPEPSVIVEVEADEVAMVIEAEEAEEAEAEFILKFPDKKAYYTRNGETKITAAFKEFLISKE